MSSSCSFATELPRGRSLEKHIGLVVGFIVVLSLALRLPNLDGSLWIDEAGSLAHASARDFWSTAHQDVHPPLYYLLLKAGLSLTSSIPLLRLFSVACGVTLAALAAWSLRSSLTAAIVAGAIGAATPELLQHSQQLRPYALLYLLLGAALVLAAQLATDKGGSRARILLSLVLLVAAATHLVTGFFLLALVPLLWWPARGRHVGAWLASLWPLLPAGLMLLWLKFAFVTQPKDLAGGWWMPAVNVRVTIVALGEAVGWDNVGWLSDACARRLLLAGWGVQYLAMVALVVSFSTAWGHSHTGPLRELLLVTALIYCTALIGYSLFFEPILMARTLLPGLIPLCAGLAWGIGHHPLPWRRWSAVAAVLIYLTLAVLPTSRRAWSPTPGLRGLAAAMQAGQQPGDAIILFHALDYGLAPYWPNLPANQPLQFDTTHPIPPQMHALRAELAALGPGSRIWVAYRDDFYFRQNPTAYSALCEAISAHHRIIRIFWQEAEYTLLLAEPVRAAP